MLIECLLAIISSAPSVSFGRSTAQAATHPRPPFSQVAFPRCWLASRSSNIEGIAYTLLILAVSAFCLTSLDTATRLGRYMFQELWVPAGKSMDEATGCSQGSDKPLRCNPCYRSSGRWPRV